MLFNNHNRDLYQLTMTPEPEPTYFVHIEDIVIPNDFAKTKVGYNKVRMAKEYYQRHNYMDKPISVIAEISERNLPNKLSPNKLILIDEYSRYKAASELGLKEVEVRYIDIDTYCEERNI